MQYFGQMWVVYVRQVGFVFNRKLCRSDLPIFVIRRSFDCSDGALSAAASAASASIAQNSTEKAEFEQLLGSLRIFHTMVLWSLFFCSSMCVRPRSAGSGLPRDDG